MIIKYEDAPLFPSIETPAKDSTPAVGQEPGTTAPPAQRAETPTDQVGQTQPTLHEGAGQRRDTDASTALAPLAEKVGQAIAQGAPGKPGFWRKLLDTLIEIVGRLVFQNPETETYNGAIDNEAFERAGRDLINAQDRKTIQQLGKADAGELWGFLQQPGMWRQAPEIGAEQREKITAALFRGMQGALATAPGAGPSANVLARGIEDLKLRELNTYATARLGAAQEEIDRKLSALGISDAPRLDQVYDLSLSSDYFKESDLDSPEEMSRLREQVDETVAFLKRLHVGMDGKKNSLVRFVEIVPQSRHGDRSGMADAISQRPLDLESSTLFVRVPDPGRALGHDFEPVTLEHLQSAWNEGAFFDNEKLQAAWKIANPAGEIRTTLRHAVLPAAGKLLQRLKMAVSGDVNLESRLGGFLNSEIPASAKSRFFGGQSLLEVARNRLASASQEQLQALQREFSAALADQELVEQAGNAAFLNTLDPAHRDIKKKVTQFTLIGANVENLHEIRVLARFAPDDGLRQYAPPPKKNSTVDIEVRQFNLIGANVSTHDFVDVSVEVAGHVLKAAALDRALARVFGPGTTVGE